MTGSPNKLIRFWKELKRRRVVYVITVYASAAFVLIELVNNLAEPLNLPSSLATIVIIVLAVGFPLAVILGWIYDLTPEGIEKTKPVEETDEGEPVAAPNFWKIATYASFIVIAGLILLNIFRGPNKLKASPIDSLVILPFENYTGDDQLENMVSSMHSLLIGDIGRISGLRITGSTSSKIYKDVEMTASDISKELNVDAVVETSVMSIGDTIWMQFRLLNTTGDEEQLWVGDYKDDKSQFLNIYNRVAKQIAKEVRIELTEREEFLLGKDREGDRDAVDTYIKSYAYWGDLGSEDLDKAEEYLSLAIEKDPDWAPLYGAMAVVWVAKLQMNLVEIEHGRQKLFENLDKANELDPDFTDSHFIRAAIATWTDWDWETGEKEFLKALAANPSHVLSRMYYAHLLMTVQRMDEALVQAKIALDLDPMNPLVLALYSIILKGDGQHESVLEYLEKALEIDPEHSFTRGQLGRAYYNHGDYPKDLELHQKSLSGVYKGEELPDLVSLFREQGKDAAYKEVARLWEQHAKSNSYHPHGLAVHLYRAGEHTKAIDELEKGYALHNPNMPYIGTGTRYELLHDSARFLAILDSMKLPHPKK